MILIILTRQDMEMHPIKAINRSSKAFRIIMPHFKSSKEVKISRILWMSLVSEIYNSGL